MTKPMPPSTQTNPRQDELKVPRPHVILSNLSKFFGDIKAVDSLELEIEKGSFTTLLGPSGCGKTTTLRMLAGFYDPDTGDILINDVSQLGRPPFKRNISIVFQDYALFPHMTVGQNLAYGLKLQKIPPAERQQRVDKGLDFLGLTQLKDRHPHELSGGQQQRVALGRSIVMEPDVLLMDEPLSNLDAKLRIRVRVELKEIQRALGLTTIYVTHDQDEALSLSDRVAVMSEGRLQQYSDPWTLYNEPANPFVADFVGHTNFLPIQALKHEAGNPVAIVLKQPLRCRSHLQGLKEADKESVLLMVRPEWFIVSPSAADTSNQRPHDGVSFEATVAALNYLGSHIRAWVDVMGLSEQLVIDMPALNRDGVSIGQQLTVGIPHGRATLLAASNEIV